MYRRKRKETNCIFIISEFADRREGINPAVTTEVADIFKGKSTNQLKLLEDQIKAKLNIGEGIDVGTWSKLCICKG